MKILLAIDELVNQAQTHNIQLLSIQPNQSLTIFNLQDAIQTAVDILYHLRDEEYVVYQNFQYAEAIQKYGISEDGAISQENLEVVPNALETAVQSEFSIEA